MTPTLTPRTIARIEDSFRAQGLMRHLGAEIAAIRPAEVTLRLPFRAELTQQMGYFHAGATSALADTAGGYAALLQRIRTQMPGDDMVWAPMFERDLEQPLAGAIAVEAEVPLVITEGNYLLLDEGPFAGVQALLDACWFVETPEDLRHERLIARHERFGKPPAAARDWALGPDEANARLVAATGHRADTRVRLG